jgi:hypothetical protein
MGSHTFTQTIRLDAAGAEFATYKAANYAVYDLTFN